MNAGLRITVFAAALAATSGTAGGVGGVVAGPEQLTGGVGRGRAGARTLRRAALTASGTGRSRMRRPDQVARALAAANKPFI
ncbi:hypothetical protein GCM10010103_09770 [Streptomyces paradoxus]|uniref:Uncharacterized protein n=1 Tax=Streptomyces paradoxus TaxID=66375 RepID=A0A7W9T4U9_9ACTN|nr:hypothetical protein [Streptomyces paradoxus]